MEAEEVGVVEGRAVWRVRSWLAWAGAMAVEGAGGAGAVAEAGAGGGGVVMAAPEEVVAAAAEDSAAVGPTDSARHVNQRVLYPRVLSCIASYDVASNICQALGGDGFSGGGIARGGGGGVGGVGAVGTGKEGRKQGRREKQMATVDKKGAEEAALFFKLREEEARSRAGKPAAPAATAAAAEERALFEPASGASTAGIRFDDYGEVPVERWGDLQKPHASIYCRHVTSTTYIASGIELDAILCRGRHAVSPYGVDIEVTPPAPINSFADMPSP